MRVILTSIAFLIILMIGVSFFLADDGDPVPPENEAPKSEKVAQGARKPKPARRRPRRLTPEPVAPQKTLARAPESEEAVRKDSTTSSPPTNPEDNEAPTQVPTLLLPEAEEEPSKIASFLRRALRKRRGLKGRATEKTSPHRDPIPEEPELEIINLEELQKDDVPAIGKLMDIDRGSQEHSFLFPKSFPGTERVARLHSAGPWIVSELLNGETHLFDAKSGLYRGQLDAISRRRTPLIFAWNRFSQSLYQSHWKHRDQLFIYRFDHEGLILQEDKTLKLKGNLVGFTPTGEHAIVQKVEGAERTLMVHGIERSAEIKISERFNDRLEWKPNEYRQWLSFSPSGTRALLFSPRGEGIVFYFARHDKEGREQLWSNTSLVYLQGENYEGEDLEGKEVMVKEPELDEEGKILKDEDGETQWKPYDSGIKILESGACFSNSDNQILYYASDRTIKLVELPNLDHSEIRLLNESKPLEVKGFATLVNIGTDIWLLDHKYRRTSNAYAYSYATLGLSDRIDSKDLSHISGSVARNSVCVVNKGRSEIHFSSQRTSAWHVIENQDLLLRTLRRPPKAESGPVYQNLLKINSDGTRAISVDILGMARYWSIEDFKEIRRAQLVPQSPFESLRFAGTKHEAFLAGENAQYLLDCDALRLDQATTPAFAWRSYTYGNKEAPFKKAILYDGVWLHLNEGKIDVYALEKDEEDNPVLLETMTGDAKWLELAISMDGSLLIIREDGVERYGPTGWEQLILGKGKWSYDLPADRLILSKPHHASILTANGKRVAELFAPQRLQQVAISGDGKKVYAQDHFSNLVYWTIDPEFRLDPEKDDEDEKQAAKPKKG